MNKWEGCFLCDECGHRWSEHQYQYNGEYLCPIWTKKVLDEAISLGIFTREGKDIKQVGREKKKVSISKGLLDRLLEQFK